MALAGQDGAALPASPATYRGLLPGLARTLDRLLPPVLRDAAPGVLLRARFLVAVALISLVPALAGLIVALSMSWYQILVPTVLRTGMLAAAVILLRRRGRIELPGHLLLGVEMSYLAWVTYDMRALFPLMALSVLPMAALLLCGRRAGWAWLGVACALSVGMVLASDIPVGGVAAIGTALLAPVQLALVVFVLGWIYDVLKRRALHELEQQRLQALASERRIHESERRALEAEHARAQAQARAKIEESFRMVSLGTLSAGVAHEINNPLAFVMANVQFLGDMLRDVEHLLPAAQRAEMQEIFADTSDGLSRIRRIVRDLSTFSRSGVRTDASPGPGEPGKPEAGKALDGEPPDGDRSAVDVRTVVEAAVNLAQSQLGQHARLVRDYQPVPLVTASEPQLAQVFLNLLINAAQAIPAGAAASNEILVRTGADEQGRAFVEVRDTGVGIPAEHLPRLFDPFFTTRPQGEGMGLGLSICHGIVAQLGGEITVESEIGQGSRFRVALPASAYVMPTTGVQVALPRARAASVVAEEVLRILVVDDEAAVGRMMARMLGGHEVHMAVSGRDAMALLDSDSGFDVIFCDLMMPGVSGMDLYTHVTRVQPALAERFVFITAGAFTPSAQALVEEHAHACLTKPLDEKAVQAQVARVLVQARAEQRAAR